MRERQQDKRASLTSRPAISPFSRLWHWLTGTSIVEFATTKMPAAGKKHHKPPSLRRRLQPRLRRFPVPLAQLAALTNALNTGDTRSRLPNLLVVEQTLLLVSGGKDLAAVPDFVLAKSRQELQSMASFRRSKTLQAFDEAVGRQVRRNEQAQQALLQAGDGEGRDDEGGAGAGGALSSGLGDEGDFEDTLPSELGNVGEGDDDAPQGMPPPPQQPAHAHPDAHPKGHPNTPRPPSRPLASSS